ncbi:hypothetical protein LFM09_36750 [Lentzea alba]|uniref:hypothetical protein n=1 Tax=Lentzea alba TaxID=2714351 RepID=UPI0039BF27F2
MRKLRIKSNTSPEQVVTLTAADQARRYPYVMHGVDPRTLRTNQNSRRTRDVREERSDLVSAVEQFGLDTRISMITVADEPEGLTVLVGHHRHAAAVAVKEDKKPDLLIDVLVHAPGTTPLDLTVAQAIENMNRQSYTQDEEVALYLKLEGLGMDAGAIAKVLPREPDQVEAGLAVAATTRTRAAVAELPEVDLLILSELAEFEDDEALHALLVEVLRSRPGTFAWELKQARNARERKANEQAVRDEAIREFTDKGYAILDEDDQLPDTIEELEKLCAAADAAPIDPAQHAECPGRAVHLWVTYQLDVRATEYCVDFASHGHRTIASVVISSAKEKLRDAGVLLVDREGDNVVELERLFHDADSDHAFTSEEHENCPGHAAYVDDELDGNEADIRFVCTDYISHGHVLDRALPEEPSRSASWKALEVKRAKCNNDLWEAAEPVRRDWLKEYFKPWRSGKVATSHNGKAASKPAAARAVKGVGVRTSKDQGKRAPKFDLAPKVRHLLTRATVQATQVMKEASPSHRYACELLGLADPTGTSNAEHPIVKELRKQTVGEDQITIIQLAQLLGACEEYFNHGYTVRGANTTWRQQIEDVRFYFEALKTLGYRGSHVEQLVLNPELDNEKWPHLVDDTAGLDEAA